LIWHMTAPRVARADDGKVEVERPACTAVTPNLSGEFVRMIRFTEISEPILTLSPVAGLRGTADRAR
jgi:hypothetical protein